MPGKASKINIIVIVPKPTQVDRASSLRGTGEPSLRNSAKNLDVSSRDVFPVWFSGNLVSWFSGKFFKNIF